MEDTEQPAPQVKAAKQMHLRQGQMFADGSDLPLFSGTPQQVIERPFAPQDHTFKQALLPGMPDIDYDAVLKKDKALRRRRVKTPTNTEGML